MNLDSILVNFHTEITKLENEGRGGEALWSGLRVAVQGLMTHGLSLCSQTREYGKAVEIFNQYAPKGSGVQKYLDRTIDSLDQLRH